MGGSGLRRLEDRMYDKWSPSLSPSVVLCNYCTKFIVLVHIAWSVVIRSPTITVYNKSVDWYKLLDVPVFI